MSDENGCREAFEAWARREGHPTARIYQDHKLGVYEDIGTSRAWRTWQAAWSTRPAPQVEDLVKALEECRRLLADLTSRKPGESPPGSTIITLYARCVEAETKARAALAAYQQKDGK